MKTLLILRLFFLFPLFCLGTPITITFHQPPATIGISEGVMLHVFEILTLDEGSEVKGITYTINYQPAARFLSFTNNPDVGGYGYCLCDRTADYDLFSNWQLIDNFDNVLGTGRLVRPPPEGGPHKIVFSDLSYIIQPGTFTMIRLVANLSDALQSDLNGGFISEDKIGISLLKSEVIIENHDTSERQDLFFSNVQPTTRTVVKKPKFSAIECMQPMGEHMLINAFAEQGKKYVLEAQNIGGNWVSQQCIQKSIFGQVQFLHPKSPGVGEFFRVRSVEDADLAHGVEIEITLPNETVSPGFYLPGTVEVRSAVVADPAFNLNYFWTSDSGETSTQENFYPSFGSGAHWVKLRIQTGTSEATAFKWVMIE